MQNSNLISLRQTLAGLPVSRLQEMLHAELKETPADGHRVRLLLDILEEREGDAPPQRTSGEDAIWRRYQDRMKALRKKPLCPRRWMATAASLLLLLGLLFTVVPQRAQADTIWEMLQRLTGTVLEFLGPKDQFAESQYVFVTSNEGLQQVYDAVVELGVTEPVVPMWLPDGFLLTDLVSKSTPTTEGIHARFEYDSSAIIYKLDVYAEKSAHQFYKDDTYYKTHERNDTVYNVTRNNERWVTVWTKDNIECFLTLDCSEETLWRILDSIYVTEDTE